MKINAFLGNIQFWILLFFVVRLVGITNPPLETSHNWRQCTGLMVARNFYEVDSNILYPRVDDNQGESGIIGMEFPTMNYFHYLLALLFGYTHWYGRLLNLIVSSLGLLFFSKLLDRLGFPRKMVFASTIALAVSIWFTFSRKTMPDTYCISFIFIALYVLFKYLDSGRLLYLIAYILIASFAVLSKIPAIMYLIFVIPITFCKKLELKRRVFSVVTTTIPVVLCFLWYFKWNMYLMEQYGTWYNHGKPLMEGIGDVCVHWKETLDNFYFDAFKGYLFFIVGLYGLVVMAIRKERLLWMIVLLFSLIFGGYICKSSYCFYDQNYYIIPYVPIMAVVVGYALSELPKQWLFVTILAVCSIESIVNQQHDFFIHGRDRYKISLETIADSISKPSDLIMINGGENPQLLYLSHRKGWTCTTEQMTDNEFVRHAVSKGCKYAFVDKRLASNSTNMIEQQVYEDEHFYIFQLSANDGKD